MTYEDFLKTKELQTIEAGFDVPREELNTNLFEFQKDIVGWALKKGKAAVFSDCGSGKGQPYGSKVLTENGWVEIQNLKNGVNVLASDGKFYPITGVYPKQEIDTYRFYYTDNTSLVFDKDHLHITRTQKDRYRKRGWKVMSTTDLLECGNLRYGENGRSRNYDIPIVKPVEYPKKEYMISPYVLGVLLGDGLIKNQVSISNPDMEIIERVKSELPKGVELEQSNCDPLTWKIKTGLCGTRKHPFRQELDRLGVLNKLSYEKFIPEEYMTGSIEQRLDLVRGLMDTDGTINESQVFYTTSPMLRDGIMELLQSLGGIPNWSLKHGKYKKNGKYIECRDCYCVHFSLKPFNPFYLTKKAVKWNSNPRGNGKWIDRIEYEGKQKTVCISVDSPDHSYVTENYTVTHNTIIQLEFANQVVKHTGRKALIVAPLAVVGQTKREGERFGIQVNICREQKDIKDGVNITNYEILEHFSASDFVCVVLDESSILKSFTSTTRNLLIDMFAKTPYKLACTATPSPNDTSELANHCEFLGIMSRTEMLATYFIHDGSNTSAWRLKGHGEKMFWEWMATWAVCVRNPADLGYSAEGYELPNLNIIEHIVKSEHGEYELIAKRAESLSERREARKESMSDRIKVADEIVKSSDDVFLVWCDYNIESENLHKAIESSVEVVGADSPEFKAETALAFADNKIKALVSKTSIYGMGMNFQNCHEMIFCGISDSFESYYQAVRRCWRYGQTNDVNVHIIISEKELNVLDNIKRKQALMDTMQNNMIALMHDVTMSEIKHTTRITTEYKPKTRLELAKWIS